MNTEPTEHITTTEARGGVPRPMARHALVIGTGILIAIFLAIFLIG